MGSVQGAFLLVFLRRDRSPFDQEEEAAESQEVQEVQKLQEKGPGKAVEGSLWADADSWCKLIHGADGYWGCMPMLV